MSNGDANPFPVPTLYDLVLQCASGAPPYVGIGWMPDYRNWYLACWIKDQVATAYAPQTSCPAKVPPQPTSVAAKIANTSELSRPANSVGGDYDQPSVIETAALQYAQDLFLMGQGGYQIQAATCAMQPGGQPSPPPLPPVPVPGGQPQPQLPPTTPPPSPARAVLWFGAIALAGAFFWTRRKKR